MGRGTSLGYLPPLGKSSPSLGRVGWEVLGDQWSGMTSRKPHKHCAVNGRVPKVSCMTVFGKGSELKNWIFKQPVNSKGCSSIQFFLRELYKEYKKVLLSFLGLESSISQNIRNFFRVLVVVVVVVCCFFSSSESSFLKCFILKARKFHFWKYNKIIIEISLRLIFVENLRKNRRIICKYFTNRPSGKLFM